MTTHKTKEDKTLRDKNNSAHFDVIIIGGGMVGFFLATLLAQAHIRTAIVEEKKIPLLWDRSSLEPRVSAINLASQYLLKMCGVWDEIPKEAFSSLRQLTVWDDTTGSEIIFDSAAIGQPQLGAIVENRAIVRALWKKLERHPFIQFFCPHKAHAIVHTAKGVEIILDNQETMTSDCVVGADGGQSWVRQQMGVSLTEYAHQQNALIAVVESENPHHAIAWQTFLHNGILALLPLANKHHSALVWSVATQEAKILTQADEKHFNQALNNAFGFRLGKLKRLQAPIAFPLLMRHAKKYAIANAVLIGDAAHTIHPLAGQGVNLGFMDAACLAECFVDAHKKNRSLGNSYVLRKYERWRIGHNTLMFSLVLGLKELFASDSSLFYQRAITGCA